MTLEIPVGARWPLRSAHPLPIAGCLLLLLLCGCASMRGASPSSGAKVVVPPNTGAAPPVTAPPPGRTESSADTGPSANAAPSAGSSPSPTPAKPNSSAGDRPVRPGSASATPHQPVAPAMTSKSLPAIDLPELERRLRDTRAIGVFTKLSLKNQVDDLLGAFRTLYQGPNKRVSPATV
jgi:hypothetical protein